MKSVDIKKLVKPSVRDLRAYEAKEIPCKVKLDANESPYGFDKALLNAQKRVKTNRYPDPEAKELRKIIGKTFRVAPDDILQGNGSDELIYYLITTFGGPVLYPVPTFSMYGIIARALGETSVAIPLEADFDLNLERTIKAIRREKPKLMFLSSPNNPTGNCFSAEKMLKIIEVSRGIVVVDEAYQPFSSGKGFLPMLEDYRELVIMKTLSKIGLAALRLGFLIADAEIITEVNKVRLPFNVNAISQALAITALQDRQRLNSRIKAIVSERGRLMNEMRKVKAITPFPSEANFILFQVRDPEAVYHELLRRGILVRNLNDGIKGCLRVTVGTPEENTIFLNAVKEALHEKVKG